MAITLTHPIHVFYGMPGHFGDEHRKWIVNNVSVRGLSERCARAALAASWKGFGEGGIRRPHINVAAFKFSVPYRTLGKNADSAQDVTMLRDVALWTHWEQWDRKKLNLGQRTRILNKWGYKCTEKAIKRVKEKILGMSLSPLRVRPLPVALAVITLD